MRFGSAAFAATAVLGLILGGPALADDLTIGARAEVTMDPHYLFLDTNVAYNRHIYGSLVVRDARAQPKPYLAESWKPVSDTVWEFKLRKGVTFHDGSAFDAADVAATIKRVPNVPGAASPYTGAIRGIVDVEIVDDHTIRFHTDGPVPGLPAQIVPISILPSEIASTVETADFNTGRSVIGAGPYKFVEYLPGDRLVLARNEAYWGEAPEWDNLTFRFISDDAARVAALLGGDVDLIDSVPPADAVRLRNDPETTVHTGPSARTIYMIMDMERDQTPFVTAKDGSALDVNPFKDRRVREAFLIAMNRDAITARVMDDLAFPAGQPVPEGIPGYNDAIAVPTYDVDRAKALLAEAGYPDGFGLEVHCTNDRYVNDDKVCQAVGQMLARIGIAVKVTTMPKSVYFGKAADHEGERFSFFMIGWSSATGEASVLWDCLHTVDKDRGLGTWNLGHYSRPEFDVAVRDAITTLDAGERRAKLENAMAMAMDDIAVIPLHYQSVIVGSRKGISYETYLDENTLGFAATKE